MKKIALSIPLIALPIGVSSMYIFFCVCVEGWGEGGCHTYPTPLKFRLCSRLYKLHFICRHT